LYERLLKIIGGLWAADRMVDYCVVPRIRKMAVFWVVAPCSLADVYQRFRGLIDLMMEAARISETLVNFYQSTWRYNQKTAIFVLTAVTTSNPTSVDNLS
jgi:hypothetical protein